MMKNPSHPGRLIKADIDELGRSVSITTAPAGGRAFDVDLSSTTNLGSGVRISPGAPIIVSDMEALGFERPPTPRQKAFGGTGAFR
jgi:hypothetical protein